MIPQNGILYGTTESGGDLTCPDPAATGCGIIFKMKTTGKNFAILYTFAGNPNGDSPAGFVRDPATGNLYGITRDGGGRGRGAARYGNWGTPFQLDASGKETIFHRFSGGKDRGYCDIGIPNLIESGRSLYGTTYFGGDLACSPSGGGGCGYVFEFDLTTKKWTHLHGYSCAERLKKGSVRPTNRTAAAAG